VKLLSLQYLRGIAALLIVFYHVSVQADRLGYHGNPFQFFSSGVDIFFVISGFVMWYTTFDRDIGTQEFFRHRIIRVVPLYWLITTFYLVTMSIQPNLLRSAKFDLAHVIKSYLFIPAPHPISGVMFPLVIQGWTLNYEMFFYALFGITLLFAQRSRALIIIGLLVFLVGLPLLAPLKNPLIQFYTSGILLEFAFGVAIGYLYTNGLSIPRPVAGFMVIAGAFALCLALKFDMSALPRSVYAGIPSLLIVAGAIFYERSGGVRALLLPTLLGDASYSLYLSHGAVLSAYGRLWHASGGPDMSTLVIVSVFYAVAVILAVIFGIMLYRFVEKPMLGKLSALNRRKAPRTDMATMPGKSALAADSRTQP